MRDLVRDNDVRVTRRRLFGSAGLGIGSVAMASLLHRDARAATVTSPAATAPAAQRGQPGLPGLPHHEPKAKRVVMLWQGGGPSHVDLFDPKPALIDRGGQDVPASVRGATRLSTMSSGYAKWPVVSPIKPFQKYGQCGMELTTMLPRIGSLADDLCLVRSMNTEAVNHAPGVTLFLSGAQVPGRPSMGAWMSYGLGCETEDLPAFVVMTSSDPEKTCGQLFFDYYWGSGFLPSRFQGVKFRNTGDPVPYLANPQGVSREARRALLDDLAAMNAAHLADYGDPEIDTRIAQYEMAYRMQASVPELVDFSDEPQHVLDRYGPDVKTKGTFASNCLIARRLLERGTRFVQLMHAGWDQHSNLFTKLEQMCRDTDAPTAALIQDLKDRGLLDDTLVIWGGEFGRQPTAEYAEGTGRDHNAFGFTMWMAGGGIKGGVSVGETDELGAAAIAPVHDGRTGFHVKSLHATVLHCLGLDPNRLSYFFGGLDQKLVGVEHVSPIHEILA
jgi:hypothetical protein